jgi:hypothetical protein
MISYPTVRVKYGVSADVNHVFITKAALAEAAPTNSLPVATAGRFWCWNKSATKCLFCLQQTYIFGYLGETSFSLCTTAFWSI